MSAAAADAGQLGWTLVQVAELVRRAEELMLDGLTLAGPHMHADMPPDAALELSATDVHRVISALAEAIEIGEHLEMLAATVPHGPVEADYEAVRDAAAADLARGIVDPRRVLLAARLLAVEHGWPALATALASGDAADTWGTLTVEALLARFRGADRETVRELAAEAGLGADARFAEVSPERLAALSDGLRRHAGRTAS